MGGCGQLKNRIAQSDELKITMLKAELKTHTEKNAAHAEMEVANKMPVAVSSLALSESCL